MIKNQVHFTKIKIINKKINIMPQEIIKVTTNDCFAGIGDLSPMGFLLAQSRPEGFLDRETPLEYLARINPRRIEKIKKAKERLEKECKEGEKFSAMENRIINFAFSLSNPIKVLDFSNWFLSGNQMETKEGQKRLDLYWATLGFLIAQGVLKIRYIKSVGNVILPEKL
jgi:hypothetical protein